AGPTPDGPPTWAPAPDPAESGLARVADHALLALADHTTDVGVVVFDTWMRIAAIAGTFVSRDGFDRDQIVGQRPVDVLSPAVWRQVGPAYAAALRGEVVQLHVEASSGAVDYDATVAPLRAAGQVVGAAVIAREVTRQRRQEATLTGVSRMFELSFDHSPIAKALVGPDGDLLRVNAAFADLLGRSREALQAGGFQELTHPDDLDRDLALLRETLAGTRTGYELEKRYRHADGHDVPTRQAVALVRNERDAPLFLIAQVVDLTRQRRLETAAREREQRDGLTGLTTRGRLETDLGLRIASARTRDATATLLALQVDAYEHAVDEHGYAAADELLRATAGVLRAAAP
ncbi:PAS domain S-box protein, partial [Patulibacter sp. S7RM1-6]